MSSGVKYVVGLIRIFILPREKVYGLHNGIETMLVCAKINYEIVSCPLYFVPNEIYKVFSLNDTEKEDFVCFNKRHIFCYTPMGSN